MKGQNVDKKGNVDNFPSCLKESLFHAGSGRIFKRVVFHVKKRNIHKSDGLKFCQNLWILWKIIFLARIRLFYRHLPPP